MSARLDAAVAELAAAIREELAAAAPVSDGPERLMSILEAAELLGIKRTSVYQEIAVGRLRSMKIRGRRLVPSSAIAERLEVAFPTKQRTGTVATARPSEESRRAPVTPDTLRPAG